jgi:hypothetical protein
VQGITTPLSTEGIWTAGNHRNSPVHAGAAERPRPHVFRTRARVHPNQTTPHRNGSSGAPSRANDQQPGSPKIPLSLDGTVTDIVPGLLAANVTR